MCFRVGILDIVQFMKQRKVKCGFGITRQGVLFTALYWIGHNFFFLYMGVASKECSRPIRFDRFKYTVHFYLFLIFLWSVKNIF